MKIILVFLLALGCAAAEADEPLPPQPRVTMPLADAVARGLVRIEAHGAGTRHVTLTAKARADVDLVIPAGTFFRANGNVQSMVVTKSLTARLDRGGTQQVSLATACANMRRPVPHANDDFELAVAEPKLQALVVCLEHRNVSDGQRQSLVWSVTDRVQPGEMRSHRSALRPFLVDACVERLKQSTSRCERAVDLAFDAALDKWLEQRDDDGSTCLR